MCRVTGSSIAAFAKSNSNSTNIQFSIGYVTPRENNPERCIRMLFFIFLVLFLSEEDNHDIN